MGQVFFAGSALLDPRAQGLCGLVGGFLRLTGDGARAGGGDGLGEVRLASLDQVQPGAPLPEAEPTPEVAATAG